MDRSLSVSIGELWPELDQLVVGGPGECVRDYDAKSVGRPSSTLLCELSQDEENGW
jgi:hypothetical protein